MRFRRLAVEVFVIAVIGAVLALLGPFGSYAMPAMLRFGYWLGFILLGYMIIRPVQTVALWLAEETPIPRLIALFMAAGLASLPLTAIVGFAIADVTIDTDYLGSAFPVLYLQILSIGLGILFLMQLLFADGDSDNQTVSDGSSPQTIKFDDQRSNVSAPELPSFFGTMKANIGSEILCLEMQDHYVNVHTSLGNELILMRLRDAIKELKDVDGLQVHRSWWVARSAVKKIVRDGRNIRLLLQNDIEVPVSRANVVRLKNSGWIP